MSSVSEHEPDPSKNNLPAIWEVIIKEMAERDTMGRIKHGGPLQPFNGRNPLWDAYQEALDLVAYLRQKIWEEEHPNENPLSPPNLKSVPIGPPQTKRKWYKFRNELYQKIYIYACLNSDEVTYSNWVGYIYKLSKSPDRGLNKWAWTIGLNSGTVPSKKEAKTALINVLTLLNGEENECC